MKYDVIIVGAGPMGIGTAYELMLKAPDKKVLLIDKGFELKKRRCPIIDGKIKQCPQDIYGNSGCKPSCSMTCGFGGSGAFSDGKFNITNEFGGWMNEYISDEEVLELIKYIDQINIDNGAPIETTDPNTPKVKEIERKGIAVGLKLLRSEVRHLGTEVNLQVLHNIYQKLQSKIDFLFETQVTDIIVDDNNCRGVEIKGGEKIYSDVVVIGVGRGGSDWLNRTLSKHGVKFTNNRVDIGVRVETNDIIMDEINEHLYEGKFIYNTSVGTKVRTFCANPSGHVVVENWDGIMVCNGHAYRDHTLGSQNTNFALLVSHEFYQPFKDPNEYAREISKLANKLSGGSVIIQKYGDIKKGRRSTPKRIEEGFVRPTLKEAVPGDLAMVLPYKTLKSVIEMIDALNYVTPGIANDHTLFYGVEAKFYSDRVDVNSNFETKQIKNLFVGGDGAGITRGLAQAGANGVKIARVIMDL
ncbi:MAG TPA: NAD(P)/FAD-dependent oxidoreductase [Acholeplasmataceae bacterium]|nr:NAD(P)/FAD-dependent oxidoreductase [Acholeplasmataceae bacterium]